MTTETLKNQLTNKSPVIAFRDFLEKGKQQKNKIIENQLLMFL